MLSSQMGHPMLGNKLAHYTQVLHSYLPPTILQPIYVPTNPPTYLNVLATYLCNYLPIYLHTTYLCTNLPPTHLSTHTSTNHVICNQSLCNYV